MNARDTVNYRLAHPREAAVLAQMSRDLIEAGLDWRYTPQRMAALMRDLETVALVACGDAARILGFALMQFGDERAHLSLLCVRREQQRRGIGRRLVGWLIESARVAGIASVELELRADNLEALAFYRSLGFAETRWLAGYYRADIAARGMALRLWRDEVPR